MLSKVLAALAIVATLAGIVALVDMMAFDKEVEAGLSAQSRKTTLEYYSRRVSEAEMRVELWCDVKRDDKQCQYWLKDLREAKRDREKFLRK